MLKHKNSSNALQANGISSEQKPSNLPLEQYSACSIDKKVPVKDSPVKKTFKKKGSKLKR